MVKIYTRKGDDGTTSLWYGGRIDKNDARTEAYGLSPQLFTAARPTLEAVFLHLTGRNLRE